MPRSLGLMGEGSAENVERVACYARSILELQRDVQSTADASDYQVGENVAIPHPHPSQTQTFIGSRVWCKMTDRWKSNSCAISVLRQQRGDFVSRPTSTRTKRS